MIDKTSADILAALILEDIRGYAARYPEEYAAFLASENEKLKQAAVVPQKRRRSRKPRLSKSQPDSTKG